MLEWRTVGDRFSVKLLTEIRLSLDAMALGYRRPDTGNMTD